MTSLRSRPLSEEKAIILRLHYAEQWPIGTIANHLGRHRDTVERIVTHAGMDVKKVSPRKRLVEPYLDFIQQTLKSYPNLRSSRLWRMLRERGYTGSQSGFRSIISRLRPRPQHEAYLRRSVLPGQEAQVDWGHFGKHAVGRATRDLWAFVMVSSYSRMRFVRFSFHAAMPSFLRGHVESFQFFGAVPRTLLYDNLKSAVLEREGDSIRFHPNLIQLASYYRFEPKPCAPYCPNEKGRVERAIRDVRENFFAARRFQTIDELNEQARAWCLELASERCVPRDRQCRVQQAFDQEKPMMMPLPADPFPVEERLQVMVGKTPYIRFDKNDYSVPHTHVARRLDVIATEERLRIIDPDKPTEVLAEHERTFDRDRQIEQPQHLQTLIERKRRAHQSRGFDRLFGLVPSSREFMNRLAEQGDNLGGATSKLLQLLQSSGVEVLEKAIVEVLKQPIVHLRGVHQVIDRLRFEAGQSPALSVAITHHPKANLHVKPHALTSYDELTQSAETEDDHAIF